MAGDYDLRGRDFETALIGPVGAEIIDADRFVREGRHGEPGWANGFPNWALYRTVYAGDTHLRGQLRAWCVAFGIAHCEAGGMRAGMPCEGVGVLAGWDAYYRLLHGRWAITSEDVADVAGVDPKTYRKVRGQVYARNLASLQEYFVRMQVALRQVWMHDRWIESEQPKAKLTSGRGFGELDVAGQGCFRVRKSTMSDNLR